MDSIRRSDLEPSPAFGDSDASPDLDTHIHAQLAEIYGFAASETYDEEKLPSQYDAEIAVDGTKDDTADTYSFRLFTTPSAAATKVVVRSPTPIDRESGFVNPCRRDSYYFAGRAGKELEERYQNTAIAGERIIEESKSRWVFSFPETVLTIWLTSL